MFLVAILLAVSLFVDAPAQAQVPAVEGSGSVFGNVNYAVAVSEGDPAPTSWTAWGSGTGTFAVGATLWTGGYQLHVRGESPAENYQSGSGTIDYFSIYWTMGFGSLEGSGTGTYVRTGPSMRINLTGTATHCDSNWVCTSGPVNVSIIVEVRDWILGFGCTPYSCLMKGVYANKSSTANQAPSAPVLTSPLEGETIATDSSIQRFTISATDPEGDLYTGEIRIKDSYGKIVSTFETAPAASGSESTGQPPRPLRRGNYIWTAKAADQWGAVGPESAPRSLSVFPTSSPEDQGPTFRASVDSQGHEGNGRSKYPAVSADGRYIAFSSDATNLVPGDTNTCWSATPGTCPDVFVRDRATGNTTRVSVSSSGTQGNDQSDLPVLSANGRYVVFRSWASNLISGDENGGDTNGYPDIFVHDRGTGSTTLVSVSSGWVQGNDWSDSASISDDGRYVAFRSWASNLVTGDTNGSIDVFVRDLSANTTSRVSVSSSGVQGDSGYSCCPAISGDGRYVAFASQFSNLVPGDTNYAYDVFVHDRSNGSTSRVSVTSAGLQGNDWSLAPSISADGRYVAFASYASNLVSGDTNSCGVNTGGHCPDIFVHDRTTQSTTRVSVSSSGVQGNNDSIGGLWGPTISDNGRFVSFTSKASNLVAADTNGYSDAFIRDRSAATTTRVSVDSGGVQANGATVGNSLSADGLQAAFDSSATNLVPEDANATEDVFRYEMSPPPEPCAGEEYPVLGCVGGESPNSDSVGLEDFYPYERWPVGTGSAYVNMATGNLVVQYADFEIPGQGLNLRLTRTYNSSRDSLNGPLGKGWTLGVSDGDNPTMAGLLAALTSLDVGRAVMILGTEDQFDFYDADGTRHHFVKGGLSGPGWHSPPGINLVLTDAVDSLGRRWYQLMRPDGVRYEVRMVGLDYRLARIADRNDNSLDFSYSADGLLSTITDVKERTLTFTWSGNYLSRVRFQSGAQTLDVNYNVDANSQRLLSVTEATSTSSARTTNFAYTSGVGLNRISDARGAATNFYGFGRVDRIADRAGRNWTFDYNTVGCQPLGGFMSTATCLTDPEGNTSTWTISSSGNLIHLRDEGDADDAGAARRNDQQYLWVDHRQRQHVDQVGNVTDYDYNSLGQLTRVSFTGNGEPTVATTMAYSQSNVGFADLKETRSATGTPEERVWRFTHDGAGNVTSVKDPMEKTTGFAYYERGLLKSVTDANGKTTSYGDVAVSDGNYDASGNPRRMTDPTGASMTLTYNFLGYPTQLVDRTASAWNAEYDLRGNLTKAITPLGDDTWYCYDANDNQVLRVSPRSGAPSCSLDGTDGYSTKMTYDSRDLTSSALTKSDTQLRKTTYSYYDDAELKEIYRPRSFDASGNLLANSSLHQKTQYLRYPNNRVRAFVDEEGHRTDNIFTPDGLPLVVTRPASSIERHRTTYSYNGRGQVKSMLSLGHSAPTSYEYNLHGEVTKQTTPEGNVTRYVYDKMGRVLTVAYPNGIPSGRTYDAVGNLLTVTNPTGLVYSYETAPDGSVTKVGGLSTTYTYNARNQIATESDPEDPAHTMEYAYDAEGRQRFRYDKYGGVTERTSERIFRADGLLSERKATGTGLSEHRATFSYDASGNPTSIASYLGGSTVSSMTTGYTTAEEVKTFAETIYTPSGGSVTKASSYGYGTDGLLGSRTIDGETATFDFFKNALEKTTVWSGVGSVSKEYLPSGSLKKVTLPNASTIALSFDLAERLNSRVAKNSDGSVLSSWEAITYDGDDRRTSEIVTQLQLDGSTKQGSAFYGYDRSGRLIGTQHPFDTSSRHYALDTASNILSDSDSTYSYTSNRLMKKQGPQQIQSYSDGSHVRYRDTFTHDYDHSGNQSRATGTRSIQITDPESGISDQSVVTTQDTSYDAAAHTQRVASSDATWVDYAYDGLDRLVRRATSQGEVTLLFHDGLTSSIALETDGAGTQKTRYLLDSLGVPLAQKAPDLSKLSYLITDPRGNLTQLVGSDQAVKGVFSYEVFGQEKPELTALAPGWDSSLRFQLARKDEKTGAYALGGRMYDPAISRFKGADHYVSSSASLDLQLDPLTGNRYLYAGANPAGMIDDGHAYLDCAGDCSGKQQAEANRELNQYRHQQARRQVASSKTSGGPNKQSDSNHSISFCGANPGADYEAPCMTQAQSEAQRLAAIGVGAFQDPCRLVVTAGGVVVCSKKGRDFGGQLGNFKENIAREGEVHGTGSPWPRFCHTKRCKVLVIGAVMALIALHAHGYSSEHLPEEH